MQVSLERRYRFSASHLYRRPDWSEQDNRARFGPCANLPGHGHNYRLFVTVAGEVDPATGFLVDLPQLDRVLEQRVLAVVDHQHLNHVIADFAPGRAIPSSENLVRWIVEQIADVLPSGVELERIRLEEDEDLAAEWRRPGD